jgi:diaminopimelate decarboxylase
VELRLEAAALPALQQTLQRLAEDAGSELRNQGVPAARIHIVPRVHLRYEGTDSALVVAHAALPEMVTQFEAAYRRRYSFLMPQRALIVEAVSVEAIGASEVELPQADVSSASDAAAQAGMSVTMLHAHIGSGPQFAELHENLARLADEFATLLPQFPALTAVSLGGGIPHNYRARDNQIPIEPLRELFAACRAKLCAAAGRELRLEIEPGRYYVAPAGTLVATVHDVKRTLTNAKGTGETFAMVDAGFVDLVRPAMYGSYHEIEVVGKDGAPTEPIVVAGPLCESGDVFTRSGGDELLQPRNLPRPEPGDLLALRDTGAYGYAMSSNYNSIGRAPQVWVEPDGTAELISRRETIEDMLKAETSEQL